MAWNISTAKRRALVKLQLRDKNGRWIEMGGGVKWYSSRLKKVVSGTVVGTQGENALVRLPKENPTHEPALVSVPARSIAVVDAKTRISIPGKNAPADATPEFEKPEAVGKLSKPANGFVKPNDRPEDWKISQTDDGRTYISRPDGADLYFPARSLDIGDEIIAPEGAEASKPFSIGKSWGRKKAEAVSTTGPKMGTVIDINGDRYAVVQLADGVVVDDPKRPGEKTNKVTVGLSNSVIKATDGLKQALGGVFDDEGFNENDGGDDQEVDSSEEANSDHAGREVPEEDTNPEDDPAADVEVDIAEATKAAEPGTDNEEDAPIREEEDPEAKAAAEADLARRVAEHEAKRKELGDQYDENGLTADEAKMVSAYDRLAAGASDPDRAANYFDKAEALRETGKKRLGESNDKSEKPADKPKEAPQTAPEPEQERQSDSNDLEAPKEKSEAEKRYDKITDEIRSIKFPGEDQEPDLNDPRLKAAESADDNAVDSEREGIKPNTDEWYDMWTSTYHSALEDNKAEQDAKSRQQEQDQAVEEDAYAAAYHKPALLSITTRGNTRGEMEYFDEVARESEIDQGYHMEGNKFIVTDLDKAQKAIDNIIDVWNDKQESAQKGGYSAETPAKVRSVLAGLEKLDAQVREAKRNKEKHASRFDGNYDITADRRLGKVRPGAEDSDYAVDRTSDELVKAMPIGGTLTVHDPDNFYSGIPVVKIDDNTWARQKGVASREWDFFDDFDMSDDLLTGVKLPDNPKNDFTEKDLNDARRAKERKDRDDKAFNDNWNAHQEKLKAERDAEQAPAKEEPAKKEQAPLTEGDQFELPLPGVQKQGKREDKSAAHKKTLDGLEEGDRVSYTNAHDETSTYQKHADGTWDLLDPEDEWEDQSPLEEALTSDEVAARTKRGDLEVATVADREEADREENYKRRLRGDDYMKSNPDPVRRKNNGDEGKSQTQQQAQDANSADQPWSADEIQGTMRDWFDFAQAVKNGDNRAIETMANNKRTGDEETDIIVNDKGQPFDLTLTYNDDGDPVVRLSNFDDSKDIYGDFEIDNSVMPKQLATLIHESINADDPHAAVAERNGSNDPVDDPSVGQSYEVSSHIGEGKNYLAKAIEDHGDSGIVINGTTADVTDLDKAQDFLRDAVLDIQGKISDPSARKNSKIELNKAQRNLNKILADVNAKQFQRDGVTRPPKWMRDKQDSTPAKSEDAPAPEAEAPKAPEAAKTNVPLADLEKQAKADGDTVLYHGGLPDGTTLDDIDLNRNGEQQNKRGRSFGGFYLTDESSKSWSDDYAMKRNGVMHGFVIDKNARIDDRGKAQIDRLSAEDRAEAAKTADVIKGKDLLGRTQYVLLNKDVIKGVGETNMKDDKSSEDSAPEANAPEAPSAPEADVTPEESAPEADAPAPVDIVDHLNQNAVLGDDAERRAAGLYLGGARYNSVLRDAAENGKEVHPQFQDQIDTLTGFIEKQPEFGQETKLYRGMSQKFLPDAENRVGDVITEPAFLSTSLKRDQAELFSGVGGGVLMEITARPQDKGLSVNIAQMHDQSDIPEEYRAPNDVTAREAEILMKPGTSMRITGVDEVNGTKVVRAEIVDAPSDKVDAEIIPEEAELPEAEVDTPAVDAPEDSINSRGLTDAEEEEWNQAEIDADVEARAGDPDGVQMYKDKADAILQRGQDRLNGVDSTEDSSAPEEPAVYTEGGPGRVPSLKETIKAIRESGVESVHIPLSDAPKKDWTPDELEAKFDRDEKNGLGNLQFDALPDEYKRYKDSSAPADPINLPEEAAPEASAPETAPEGPAPTPEQQAKLDEYDRQMDAAVEADDDAAYDKASDAKYDLIDAIRNGSASNENSDSVSDMETESEPWVNPLDALGIERRTPEAIEGEKYPPTQQQQDVIDAVLAGLDTKVQAMAGTGKTSTLVALSRRLTKEGKSAIYIAFNKTVQEEAEERMKGLKVEAKTGHGTAHTWARTNMPHLTTRLAGKDPMYPIKFDKKTKQATDWADKKPVSSSREIANILGVENNQIHEDGTGIPLSKSSVVLAVKKTVGSFQLSDKDEILPEHVPDSFEIDEADKPKIVEFANAYWDDLSREDGVFRMEHDTYRKHWALSRPDLTDGTGGNKAGASVLYIDEAQDTPPVLAKVVADQKMQKVIVGDQNQAIYAFAENIDYLSEADGDVELPLDKSWRFGPQVADIGNRFLQMLESDSRVVGGGPESSIVYGMENADAVLVRTNAGMIQVILEETARGRKVAAPPGTRADLIRMADTVENLRDGWAGENPHDDLLGFKDWNEVMAANENGDRSVSKIVSMFDEGSPTKRGMIKDYPAFLAQQMSNVRKAIDSLVMEVPEYQNIKLVKEGNRTYLEGADHLTGNKKQFASYDFSAAVGKMKYPYAAKPSMNFMEKKKAYHEAGGLGTEGWRFDSRSKRYYTDSPEVAAGIEKYSGQGDVIVSTAHKSKGLEWDRVRISDDFRAPYEDKNGAMVWPEDDEYKLAYVAVTRAAKELDPGILDYVFAHTQENGGDPKKKRSMEDSTPAPEQVEEENLPNNVPEEVAAEETDVPEVEAPAEIQENPEADVAIPETEPMGLPATDYTEEEFAKLPVGTRIPRGRGGEHRKVGPNEWESYNEDGTKLSGGTNTDWVIQANEELQKPAPVEIDAPEIPEQDEPVITPDLVDAPEPVSEPDPVPVAPAPAPTPPPAPEFDDEGLTPQERRRADELERWIAEVYKGNAQGNVTAMENELFDMLERGEKRMNPAPEPPTAAPPARETTTTPKGRAPRGTYTDQPLMDSSGKQIQMGDMIGHPRLGPVAVTGFVPHSGRNTFIDPVTGKEASVKAANVKIVNDVPDEDITDIVGQPGERFQDPATGKKAFYNGDGQPIVTGQRVVDPRTGRTGVVVSVYPGADGLASVPVQWDDAPKPAKPTRVKGILLKLAGV